MSALATEESSLSWAVLGCSVVIADCPPIASASVFVHNDGGHARQIA